MKAVKYFTLFVFSCQLDKMADVDIIKTTNKKSVRSQPIDPRNRKRPLPQLNKTTNIQNNVSITLQKNTKELLGKDGGLNEHHVSIPRRQQIPIDPRKKHHRHQTTSNLKRKSSDVREQSSQFENEIQRKINQNSGNNIEIINSNGDSSLVSIISQKSSPSSKLTFSNNTSQFKFSKGLAAKEAIKRSLLARSKISSNSNSSHPTSPPTDNVSKNHFKSISSLPDGFDLPIPNSSSPIVSSSTQPSTSSSSATTPSYSYNVPPVYVDPSKTGSYHDRICQFKDTFGRFPMSRGVEVGESSLYSYMIKHVNKESLDPQLYALLRDWDLQRNKKRGPSKKLIEHKASSSQPWQQGSFSHRISVFKDTFGRFPKSHGVEVGEQTLYCALNKISKKETGVDPHLAELLEQWKAQRNVKVPAMKRQNMIREEEEGGVDERKMEGVSQKYYGVEEVISVDGNVVFKAVGGIYKTPFLAALAYDKSVRNSHEEEEKKTDDEDFSLLNFPCLGDCALCGDLTVPLNATTLPPLPEALLMPLKMGESIQEYQQKRLKHTKKKNVDDEGWAFLSFSSARGGEKAMASSGLSKWREPTLLCDSCDNEVHLVCAGLQAVPSGKWFCPSCKPVILSSSSTSTIKFKVQEVKYLGVRPVPLHGDWIQDEELPKDLRVYPTTPLACPLNTPFNEFAVRERASFPSHWPEVQVNNLISQRWRNLCSKT